MLNDLRFRTKLWLVLGVPTAALLFFATTIVTERMGPSKFVETEAQWKAGNTKPITAKTCPPELVERKATVRKKKKAKAKAKRPARR